MVFNSRCKSGFSGPRCTTDICSLYCLNGGECKLDTDNAICICPEEFEGSRCETRKIVQITPTVEPCK